MNIRRYIHRTCLALVAATTICACSDKLAIEQQTIVEGTGHMTFNVNVLDAPEAAVTRGSSTGNVALEADNNNDDFKAGDAFGLFVVDAAGNTVEGFRNMKLTTPDGKVWNALSSVKTTVHKMGYKYYAYAPYSAGFNDCATVADIEAGFTAPAADQSSGAATDWMYSGLTTPGENGVTTLNFHHRYGVIDIYNSFDNNHVGAWTSAYQYTIKTDVNGVKHYRYILNNASPATTTVSGSYNVGNQNTGIRTMKYNVGGITVGNGYHAIVRTSRVSEDYAVDLGLPSGTKWARFNVGAELNGVMTEEQILAAEQQWGTRLSWGELWPKDTYSAATYIDTYDSESKTNALFTTHISGTANDPVKQLWGGHWEMPTQADFEELKNNVTITKTGPITLTATALNGSNPKEYTNIYLYKLTSKVSDYTDKSITMVSCGYVSNGLYNTVWPAYNVCYASGTINTGSKAYHKYLEINDKSSASVKDMLNEVGAMIRPVLKKKKTEDQLINEIQGVDLGMTETIDGVTYKVLFAPFNIGVEEKMPQMDGMTPLTQEQQLALGIYNGWRLAWGQVSKPAYFGPAYYTYPTDTSGNRLVSIINTNYDAAHVNWGNGWQMMSRAEATWVVNNCTVEKKTIDGVTNVFKITSKKNGNYIYLHGAGYKDKGAIYSDNETDKAFYSTGESGTGDKTNWTKQCALQITTSPAMSINETCGKTSGILIRPVKLVRVSQ